LGQGGTSLLEGIEDLKGFLQGTKGIDVVLLLLLELRSTFSPDGIEDLDVSVSRLGLARGWYLLVGKIVIELRLGLLLA
jgi:hypothetical protein